MDRDEFREQMTRCRECGSLMDGGCCEPAPLAYMVEREYDREGDESGPAEAVLTRRFYCLDCAEGDWCEGELMPVYDKDLLQNPYCKEECNVCGEDLL